MASTPIHRPRTSTAMGVDLGTWKRDAPVFGVGDGINDGVVDGRSLGDDGWHRVHVGRQDMRVPRTETLWFPCQLALPQRLCSPPTLSGIFFL